MKFIFWFDRIRKTIARHQGFIQIIFMNTSILSYIIILIYLSIRQKESNLYWPVTAAPYL